MFSECKAEVGHGRYLAVLKSAGIGKRFAQIHMRIAANPVLTRAHNYAHLPPSYNKLYILSQLEDQTLQEVIDAGKVRPDMTLGDVRALVANVRAFEEPPTGLIPAGIEQFCGDLRDILPTFSDESVHAFICDPPYLKEFEPLWPVIAEQAARSLVPGGSLLTLCGHHQVPLVLNAMSDHLTYWWLGGMGHKQNLTRLPGKRVATSWKPALWFVKGHHRGSMAGSYPVDFRDGESRNKRFHEWGQPTEWFSHWVEHLTKPGELLMDPTSGAGTTLVAAAL